VTQFLVSGASMVQESTSLLNRKLGRFREEFEDASRVGRHELAILHAHGFAEDTAPERIALLTFNRDIWRDGLMASPGLTIIIIQ